MEDKFSTIYKKNIWGSSGTGSNFSYANKWFIRELRSIIDKYNIKTIGDVGCGDWEIMKHFKFEDELYTGIDCVDFLVDKLSDDHGTDNIKFKCADASVDTPSGYDLVIIKDVIQHWDDETIMDKFNEILKNNKYVYCVNGYKFVRDPSKNNWTFRILDKKYSYHPIDFNKPPFTSMDSAPVWVKHRGAKQYILFKTPTI